MVIYSFKVGIEIKFEAKFSNNEIIRFLISKYNSNKLYISVYKLLCIIFSALNRIIAIRVEMTFSQIKEIFFKYLYK